MFAVIFPAKKEAEMKRTIGLAVVGLWLAGCGESKASVECAGIGVGYQCNVQHVEGGPVNLCWTLNIDCKNGTKASADACQKVDPGGKASKLIPLDQIKNASACDMATGVSVLARVSP